MSLDGNIEVANYQKSDFVVLSIKTPFSSFRWIYPVRKALVDNSRVASIYAYLLDYAAWTYYLNNQMRFITFK